MISDILIKIIIVLLPTQLGLHFWPSFSRVAGIKVDYLSPTLYLTDIFLIALVLINIRSILHYLKKNFLPTMVFVSFVAINIIFSVSPMNSLFWWLRIVLYILVFLVFLLRHLKWQQICGPLLYSTILIVSIEIIQLFLQSSIGGLFYYLGERAFSGSTPSIGRLDLFGREFIRPISTFSHSNSLAGYLLIVYYLFSKKSPKEWYKIIPFLGILLTLSKTAIVALAFILFSLKADIIIIGSLIITAIMPMMQNYGLGWQSISDREFYLPYFKKIFWQNPFTGVGLGNFIPALGKYLPGSQITPSKLQPVHNIFFLMLSETGIIGSVLLVISLLRQKIRKYLSNPQVLMLIALVIFTGTFDHYTWTLPQNKLIFLLALSIML